MASLFLLYLIFTLLLTSITELILNFYHLSSLCWCEVNTELTFTVCLFSLPTPTPLAPLELFELAELLSQQ